MGTIYGSQTSSDYVFSISVVVGSEVITSPSGDARRVAYNLSGVPGFTVSAGDPYDDLGLNEGESADEADVFSALGVIGRPIDPQESAGPLGNKYAEAICIKEQDTLVPISYRDLRLKMGGNAPNEGQLAFVGYGGGFVSQSAVDTADLEKGTLQVIYCPYSYASGVPTKAHSIIMDPTSGNESISVIHAEGQSIFMQDDGSIQMQSPDASAYIKIENGKITMTADEITMNGTVYVGNQATGVPLAAGVASPPSPRLYVSPA